MAEKHPSFKSEFDLLRENARLRTGLHRISCLNAGGPHTSAKDGMASALDALDRAKKIACKTLASLNETGEADG